MALIRAFRLLKSKVKHIEGVQLTLNKKNQLGPLLNHNVSRKYTKQLSVRQRAWREAQEIYTPHAPYIAYSSFLEINELYDNVNYKSSQQESIDNFPVNWMDDYEFYEGDDGIINSKHGTADSTITPSKVPCNGCGAKLHCASYSLPGFIPKEIFHGRTEKELQTIVCQRCHFLKHYNIALDVEVTAESYVQTLSTIKDKFALALVIVDLLDFPCSIWPGMGELLGTQRPVIVVGNKVDLLPRDCNSYLDRVKKCLEKEVLEHGAFDKINLKHIGLISAKTGYGIEELVTKLQKLWQTKGDVYLMGCTNVGKSTLFNILLNSDYCRPEATSLVRKATTCPWPGTTLHMLKFPILRPSDIRVFHRSRRLFSERGQKAAELKLRRDQANKSGSIAAAQLIGTVGRTFEGRVETNDAFSISTGTNPIITLNERSKEYREAKWCYDTPGVLHPDQLTDLLTTEELIQLQPKEMIKPRAIRFSVGMSIFLGGLARLDFLTSDCQRQQEAYKDFIKVFIFSTLQLPIVVSPTEHATEMYNRYLGSPILGLPCGTPERLERWPGLEPCAGEFKVVGEENPYKNINCDIVMSSVGWIGLSLPEDVTATFKAWTPRGRGSYMRTLPLIQQAERITGKRVRNSIAYNTSRPFVFKK